MYFFVDRFYIPKSPAYQMFSQWHEIFIYGFDRTERKIYFSDNLTDGKYDKHTCSYDEMVNAVSAVVSENVFFTCIYLLKKIDGMFKFDIGEVIHGLTNYFHSQGTRGIFQYDPSFFGLEALEKIANRKLDFYDRRMFHLLWEHKKIMSGRVVYLMENGYLDYDRLFIELFKHQEKEALNIRNLTLKYNLTNRDQIKVKIHEKLSVLAVEEYKLIKELLQRIKHATGKTRTFHISQ